MQKIGHLCAFSWAVRRENLTKSCAQVPRRFLAYQNRKTKPPEATYEQKTQSKNEKKYMKNNFRRNLFLLPGVPGGSQGDPRGPRGMLYRKSGINGHLAGPFDVKTCPKVARKYRADFWQIKNAKQPHQRRTMSKKTGNII